MKCHRAGLSLVLTAACLLAANAAHAAPGGSGPTAPAGTAPAPRHVMSLSLCTDALLLALLPPARIASVTYLAHESTDPALAAEAARVGTNYGSAEEVLAQAPDLILAGTYSTPAARTLLRQLHAPLLVVPAATSFADIRANVTRVARALGAQPRGQALLGQMDATLEQVRRGQPAQPIRVAAWGGDGYVPGRGTLFNAVLKAAGGLNVAASTRGERSGSFDIEQLLMAHPEVLAYSADQAAPALQTATADHPLLLRLYAGHRITYPQLPVDCGLPQSAAAALQLQRELLAVSRSFGPPRRYGGPP